MNNHIKDQKKVLTIASLTEFGERYSYYVIQSLLIFFLIDNFHIAQAKSAALVGTVLSMVYLSALVGGYIADKLINYYRAAFLGAILMALGSLILALSTSENQLYLGLSFISISTGLIKSNMSSFIGRYYDQSNLSEGNRDFGFNIFYVGINLGSFFALFLASWLKDSYGFSAPFYSSLIVSTFICLNLLIGFVIVKKYIAPISLKLTSIIHICAVLVIYVAVVFIVLKHPDIANFSILIACVICAWILIASAQQRYWRNVLRATLFFMLSILYWALYFQIFISILLFIDFAVAPDLFGISLKPSQFLSIESIGVLLLGTVMGKLWLMRERKGKPVHDINKFNIAFVVIAFVFILLWVGIYYTQAQVKVSALIIAIAFVILAISELSLSAIGLSMVTKLAPPKFVSLYMGIWLVTLGIGGKLAGFLSSFIHITHNLAQTKANMSNGLIIFILLSILGIIVCTISRYLTRK
ncbi:peptide MFS transporter [Facilibium subflavum]|uniref:peptide MFS transporter n=1 Tax=Facilibium subflavum TaxID=2219058 RepID=UPI000E65D429|nr:peptide MFS transporter [Facilibium subflavum]